MSDRHIVLLRKGAEKYVVVYEDGRERLAFQQLLTWASNHELSFNWRDAGEIARRIINAREAA